MTVLSRKYRFTFFFSVFSLTLAAQSDPGDLQKADRYYARKDYANAFLLYQNGLDDAYDDARTLFQAGFAALQEMRYDFAVDYLRRAFEQNARVDPFIEYHLGLAYSHVHEYRKAVEHLTAYQKNSGTLARLAALKVQQCVLADSLMQQRATRNVRPLETFNTDADEIAPLLTADGTRFVFTSDRTADGGRRAHAEDVYVSDLHDGAWTKPEPISPAINVRPREAAVWLSPDGTTVLLYYEDGQGDLYTSHYEDGAWTRPVPLNGFINKHNSRESGACISPDGLKLYFASNRPGGRGGFDLYVSTRTPGGDWGRPANLGSAVNTKGNEEYPFMHTDGTLYFSSDGHVTLGEADIFRTRQENGAWQTPANLGYPINTAGFDGYYVQTADENVAYFASRRGGGDIDLYVTAPVGADRHTVTPPASAEEEAPVPGRATLRGMVTDAASGESLPATVTIVNHVNDSVFTINTDASGRFSASVPTGAKYGMTVISRHYLPSSTRLDIPPSRQPLDMENHVVMSRAEVGSTVVLRNIFFDTNAYELQQDSRTELGKLRELLQDNPPWRIRINGHTDNVGDRQFNLALSLKRAQSVVDYLVALGVDSDRLEAKGFGPDRPLVSNDDEEDGREINRRTEIEIISLD